MNKLFQDETFRLLVKKRKNLSNEYIDLTIAEVDDNCYLVYSQHVKQEK